MLVDLFTFVQHLTRVENWPSSKPYVLLLVSKEASMRTAVIPNICRKLTLNERVSSETKRECGLFWLYPTPSKTNNLTLCYDSFNQRCQVGVQNVSLQVNRIAKGMEGIGG